MNPKVDTYLEKVKNYNEEIRILRKIVLDCGLTEELKWRVPCYTYKNANIIIINTFKDFCVLGFFKGVLLKDAKNVLVQQGENTQSARILKFTTVKEILEIEPTIKAYIYEALEVEKAGLKVELKKPSEHNFTEELQTKLKNDQKFNAAFSALTPGRQRAYNLYFAAPKQSKTKITRIEKYTQRILNGKGIHDCICGLSKKMPNCDGSHKYEK